MQHLVLICSGHAQREALRHVATRRRCRHATPATHRQEARPGHWDGMSTVGRRTMAVRCAGSTRPRSGIARRKRPPRAGCGVCRSWCGGVGWGAGNRPRQRAGTRGDRGKERRGSIRHRIVTTGAERMTTADAPDSESAAGECTMTLECAERIDRACRLEATSAAEPRAQNQPVCPHDGHQGTSRPKLHARLSGVVAAPNKASSSLRAVALRASDAALGKSLRSKGARRRTTHTPSAM